MPTESVNLSLDGVPEALLRPLWNRAAEQKRPDRLIDDPLAAELVDRLDYDFQGRFGSPGVHHVIRERVCDDLIAVYVNNCKSEPIVISLGDGIDTQPWRIGDSRIRWFSVDVPEAISARQTLLPTHHRSRTIECSALDPAWLQRFPHDSQPFISAAGLLMHCSENKVACLLAMIADWLPGATIFFDTISPDDSRKSMRGESVNGRATAPPMLWGIRVADISDFLDGIPGVRARKVMTFADQYPRRMRIRAWLERLPMLRGKAGGLVVAETYRKTAAGYCG